MSTQKKIEHSKPMLTKDKTSITIILRGSAFPFLVILVWEIAARAGVVNTFILPPPSVIFQTFINMLTSGLLEKNLLASIIRLTYGFFISIAFAIPLGILVGKAKGFRHWVNPTLFFLQQIPPLAWIPLFMLWLGIDEASKIAVIIYSSFFPIFLNTVQGVISVDPKLVEVGRTYMLSPVEMMKRVYIPSAAMTIFVGLRLGLSNCWRALVVAEMIAAASGLGSLLHEGRELSQPDKIFVVIFTIGAAGLLIDFFLRRMENRLMPWKKMYQTGEQR